METKLCRICGKLSENYVHIFKTEGLKNKIETCLPIIVSPICLLPDTICSECLENVDNFYSFIKNCLQNIIVLEAQYDITDSCLKTKRKHEKSSQSDFAVLKFDKNIQTDDDENEQRLGLVCYEIDSDTNSECDGNFNEGKVILAPRNRGSSKDLISEITLRKSLKRKYDSGADDLILTRKPKIFKSDTNRRKSRQPKKLEFIGEPSIVNFDTLEKLCEQMEKNKTLDLSEVEKLGEYTEEDKQNALQQVQMEISNSLLPPVHICLLCEQKFTNAVALSSHVFDMHGIDLTQSTSSPEKKKKVPELLKITDVAIKTETIDNQAEEAPTLQPSFICPICPAMFSNRSDLFMHLRVKHPMEASVLCGLCLQRFTTYANLITHLENCKQQNRITYKYVCKICNYSDDNSKCVENHVVVHDFVLMFCKKQLKMFDPSDYIEINPNCEGMSKLFNCTECEMGGFATFREFSTHRRSQHQIFHCDLCNKFYGRNSHLWKHVNRLHKGHPSITCQLCYKTSASKYHLSQHFNKIHNSSKQQPVVKNNDSWWNNRNTSTNEDFMSQKFRAFDFQSVRQSFMRQEILERERDEGPLFPNSDPDEDEQLSKNTSEEEDSKPNDTIPPKEIDSSSDLYTNIITNYTPPRNEGEFKCPKCFKGFHKKTLLKKHKKNCRPRLQKDLLTRCKTCSRIFKDRQSLTKHLINYHSEYNCEICGQKVQSKCEIVSHIRFSHPDCHLFCNQCGNILRNRADLAEHQQEHHDSFVCQFCGDALPTKIKLKMHILSLHRKILSLSCGICLKLFETQYILKDHVNLVHRDSLTPLTSCTVCGKNYGSKWKTYDHLNKSHGRIFKACKACLKVFNNEEELSLHYSSVHDQQIKKEEPSQQNNSVLEDENVKKELQNSVAYESDYENNWGGASDDGSNEEFEDETFSEAQEAKISLLEKRLLGKALPIKVEKANVKDKKFNNVINNFKTEILEESCEMNSSSSHSQTLQNSSKRTVYVNSNDPSLCEICLKTWPAKKHLWQHYIRCHKTVAATVCGICLKTNPDYETLQLHLRENHPTLLHGQGFGSNFICRICGRYHNASSKLKLHMAIHENFNWSILEDVKIGSIGTSEGKLVCKNEGQSNGYADESKEMLNNEDINYESMIEQVECTSESECEDSDNENGHVNSKQEDTSSEEDDEDDDESDPESVVSENSLETRMLHNMLNEKPKQTVPVVPEAETKIKVEVYSTSEEESEDSSNSTGETYSSEEVAINGKSSESLLGGQKPSELDSAIRSISYHQVDNVDDELDSDFCEIQVQNLNENEIETAVDSIL